jgi:hypothetical protein
MQSEKPKLVHSSTTVHQGEQVASTSSPQPTRENANPMEMATNTLQNTPSLVVLRAACESLPKVGIVERSCPRSIRRNVAVDRPIPGYGRLFDVLDCEVIDI